MHKLAVASCAMMALSGVCFAQAPVVDATQMSAQTQPQTDVITSQQLTGSIEQRLNVLERIVESRSDTQQRMQAQLDLLQSDVDGIRGSIELHSHQLEKILERQRDLFLELENRFAALETQRQSVAVQLSEQTTEEESSVLTTSTTPSNGGDVKQAYQDAVNLILQQRDYEAAIPAFRTFLTNYPGSAFTDNAHYWLGQLLFNKKQWADATTQFTQVMNNFPDSTKRPDAILKLGMIARQTNELATSIQLFEKVVAEYPDSTVAKLAAEQLSTF